MRDQDRIRPPEDHERDGASVERDEADPHSPTALHQNPLVARAMYKRRIQRKAAQKDAARNAQIPASGGAPLTSDVRARMEGALGGADLSAARVHTGGDSAQAAAELGARAFTTGHDVHFGRGEFAPGTKEGDRLIAHELAHVVQGAPSGVQRKTAHGDDAARDAVDVSQPGDPAEQEADAAADGAAESLHGNEHAAGAAPPVQQAAGGKKISRKGDKDAAPPKHAAGETGIVSKEVTVELGGKPTKLPNGTAVSVVKDGGETLTVQVGSGFGKKEATIKAADFEKQPGVAIDEDTGKERDYYYETYKGSLFGKDGTPKASDPHQGYIGDCYLISAMAAVAARNPGAIKALFNPQTPDAPAYQVTLYKRGDDGKFAPTAVTVDRKLPTAAGDKDNPSYAQEGAGAAAPLWPALLEKAYAQFVGGYAKAGEGGASGNAMEALTGVKQDMNQMPDKDHVIEQFKGYEKSGKAVTVSTLGSVSHKQVAPFSGKDGQLSGKLTGDEGQPVEIAKGSVWLDDKKSKKHQLHAFDDEKGAIKANVLDKGTIDYATGKIDLQFNKGQAPDDPKNIEADYDYKGLISQAYNLFANHAYIFDKVQGDNLVLRNPWNMGDKYEPKPIPASAFIQFFNDISSTTVPDEKSCPVKPS